MLDLKAKLAAAGLVSAEEIERAEAKKRAGGGRRPRRGGGGGRGGAKSTGPKLDAAGLVGRDKGQQYDAIRRYVDAARLDPIGRMPSEHARTFHFPTEAGGIGRLVLEPQVVEALTRGDAGVVAFMSNHGLAHAVVPASGARAIAELFPQWLRALADPDAPDLEQEPEHTSAPAAQPVHGRADTD